MKGCPYCKDFDPIWNTIVHLFKNIQTKKIERLHHPNLIKQFNVGSFPTIILKKNDQLINYNYDRNNINRFKKFFHENNVIV